MKKSARKRLVAALLLSTILLLSGCVGNKHKITVATHQDLVVSCPKSAKAGDTVKIETMTVTDGEINVTSHQVEIKRINDGLYEFTMPDENVEIRIGLYIYPDGA